MWKRSPSSSWRRKRRIDHIEQRGRHVPFVSSAVRLYLLVVRPSHEDLPHLQRGLALVAPVARTSSGRTSSRSRKIVGRPAASGIGSFVKRCANVSACISRSAADRRHAHRAGSIVSACWRCPRRRPQPRGDRFGKHYRNAGFVTREDFLTAVVVAPIGNGRLRSVHLAISSTRPVMAMV